MNSYPELTSRIWKARSYIYEVLEMSNVQPSISDEQREELHIQVLIAEFGKLREEELQAMNTQQQMTVLALGSASIAIPILVGQTANIPVPITAVLLYSLAIVYAVIAMMFASASFVITIIGKYVHEYVEPEINRLLKTSPEHRVLYWESFLRRERTNIVTLFLGSVGAIGSTVLIMLPSIASLLTAQYVLLLPTIQAPQQSATLQFVSSCLVPISIVAQTLFVLGAISIILGTVYARWVIS